LGLDRGGAGAHIGAALEREQLQDRPALPIEPGLAPPATAAPARRHLPPLLKLALELGPLGIFFFANARFDLFTATAAFMVATVVSLSVSYALVRRVPVMPLISGALVLVFGGLTLALQDELFIKLKPTVINLMFAAVLLGGLAFGKPLLGYVFDEVVKLDAEGWRKLTLRWGLFFIVLAVLNEVMWRTFSTHRLERHARSTLASCARIPTSAGRRRRGCRGRAGCGSARHSRHC
jgi:intracellular septation protein